MLSFILGTVLIVLLSVTFYPVFLEWIKTVWDKISEKNPLKYFQWTDSADTNRLIYLFIGEFLPLVFITTILFGIGYLIMVPTICFSGFYLYRKVFVQDKTIITNWFILKKGGRK